MSLRKWKRKAERENAKKAVANEYQKAATTQQDQEILKSRPNRWIYFKQAAFNSKRSKVLFSVHAPLWLPLLIVYPIIKYVESSYMIAKDLFWVLFGRR